MSIERFYRVRCDGCRAYLCPPGSREDSYDRDCDLNGGEDWRGEYDTASTARLDAIRARWIQPLDGGIFTTLCPKCKESGTGAV